MASRAPASCGNYTLPGFKELRAEYSGESYDCIQSSQDPSSGALAQPRWAWQEGTGLFIYSSAIATQSETRCGFTEHCGEAGLHRAEKGSCLHTHTMTETFLGGWRSPELARLRQWRSNGRSRRKSQPCIHCCSPVQVFQRNLKWSHVLTQGACVQARCPHRLVHMSPCSSHRKCHVTSCSQTALRLSLSHPSYNSVFTFAPRTVYLSNTKPLPVTLFLFLFSSRPEWM